MTLTTDLPQAPARQRNWAPWIALLLALVAMLSNAAFFMGLPGQSAIPWLSVALAIAALVCAAVGIMRAFRQPQVYGGKVSSSILGVLALLICGLVALRRSLRALCLRQPMRRKSDRKSLTSRWPKLIGIKVSLDQLLGTSARLDIARRRDPRPIRSTLVLRSATQRPCCWSSIVDIGDHSATSSYEAYRKT